VETPEPRQVNVNTGLTPVLGVRHLSLVKGMESTLSASPNLAGNPPLRSKVLGEVKRWCLPLPRSLSRYSCTLWRTSLSKRLEVLTKCFEDLWKLVCDKHAVHGLLAHVIRLKHAAVMEKGWAQMPHASCFLHFHLWRPPLLYTGLHWPTSHTEKHAVKLTTTERGLFPLLDDPRILSGWLCDCLFIYSNPC
jgi:hypothetical protein